jgi:hypothetical protein
MTGRVVDDGLQLMLFFWLRNPVRPNQHPVWRLPHGPIGLGGDS